MQIDPAACVYVYVCIRCPRQTVTSGESNLRTRVFWQFSREKEKIRVFSQELESFGDLFFNFKNIFAAKKIKN
jgi:hypothetical protein